MNWIVGILGIWILVEPFLGFSVSLGRILLVITGLAIAVLSFWPKNGSTSSSLPMGSGMHGPSGETHHEPPHTAPGAGGPMGGQSM